MSSSNDFHDEDPQRIRSSTDSPSVSQSFRRVTQAEATGRTPGSSTAVLPRSASSNSPIGGFLNRAQRDERYSSSNRATPTRSNAKSQSCGSESTQSSSTDGGVLLYPKQTSNVRKLNPASSHGLRVNPSSVATSDIRNQSLASKPRQNMSAGQIIIGAMSPRAASGQLSAYSRVIFFELQQTILNHPTLSQAEKEMLNQMLLNMLLDTSTALRGLRQDLGNVKGERDTIRRQKDEDRRQLESIIQDRVRISVERDNLQRRIRELGSGPKEGAGLVGDAEKHLKQVNEELLERIRIQDEQLRGKRALWMDANPHSASRRRAMNALQDDPFSSPMQTEGSGIGGGKIGGIKSPYTPSPLPGSSHMTDQGNTFQSRDLAFRTRGSFAPSASYAPSSSYAPPTSFTSSSSYAPPTSYARPSSYGPPPLMRFSSAPSGPSDSPSMPSSSSTTASPNRSNRNQSRRRRNIPVHSPMMANEAANSIEPAASLCRFHTDPSESMAMVPFDREHGCYLEFKTGIGNVYKMVQDWANAYANYPDAEKDKGIAKSNRPLWDYMMNCTYPGHRHESHAHVLALLDDLNARFLFITRMAITYCIQDIMSVETFKAFSPEVSVAIEDAKIRLQERGLANDARQILIDRQVEAVQSITNSHMFGNFRQEQINLHTKRLRDMLGPLLNRGCPRSQAGKDLGLIAVTAWDLSVKMHTSHLTFQVYFPETAAKFSSATMLPTNSTVDPLKLQLQQARLSLVITPVITMRDDRGTTIKAKNLHMASVLLQE